VSGFAPFARIVEILGAWSASTTTAAARTKGELSCYRFSQGPLETLVRGTTLMVL